MAWHRYQQETRKLAILVSQTSNRRISQYVSNSTAGTSAGSTILRNVPGMHLQPPEPGISPSDQASSINASIAHGAVLSAHLFDSAIQNELIDAYFTCYNTSYPILHERTFRRKCQDRQQIEATSSWHAIFYAVLAIGSWIRGGAAGSEQCPYQSAARSRMSMQMLESGTLVTVQAFLLMVWPSSTPALITRTDCETGQLSSKERPPKYSL